MYYVYICIFVYKYYDKSIKEIASAAFLFSFPTVEHNHYLQDIISQVGTNKFLHYGQLGGFKYNNNDTDMSRDKPLSSTRAASIVLHRAHHQGAPFFRFATPFFRHWGDYHKDSDQTRCQDPPASSSISDYSR